MAYQDDFRNKVLAALKAKNLAVDISQEATQQAIVEEVQNVAASESRPMSAEEMRSVLQDVANQLATDNGQAFTAQSADFTAYYTQQSGGPGGSYSGGGIAQSVMNKDIMIIPTAGTATSINTLSQIDFKIISNPNAYGVIDPNEVKSSLYNWGERVSGNTYDTPVLGLGGAWNGVSYTPTSSWGIGGSQGSGVGGSIATDRGFGQIIYFKPATSTIYAAIINDLGLDTSYSNGTITLTGYQQPVPGTFPTAGFAVTFGGIGGSGDLIIQGAALSTQLNTVKFYSSFTVQNSTITDTITLGMSSQALAGGAQNVYYPGGTGQTTAVYVLAAQATTFALGDIFYSGGIGHTTLVRLPIAGNNQYLSVTNGVPAWTNTISATTVAVSNAGTATTVLYPLLNNAAGAGSAVSTDTEFYLDPANNILRYQSGSFYAGIAVSAQTFTGAGSLVTYTSPATVIIKPGTNAVNAILMQASAGSTVVNVDTNNGRVSIGSGVTAPVYTLDVLGDTNLSTGSVYRIAGAQILSSNTLGSSVLASSLTSVGTLTGGTWQASTIAADRGGTGQNSYTIGDLLYGTAGNTLSKLAAVAAGSFLVSDGTSTSPKYVAGSGVSVGSVIVTANTANTENYIPFVSGIGGVGLSISNSTGQLTYNPNSQVLKVTIASGTAFTATNLTGTLQTASQPNVTSASALATVGNITVGNWNSAAIGLTYGGTGANLGPGAAVGNSNRIIVTGNTGAYASSLIDNSASGSLLVSGGALAAPTFTNTTAAAFTFSSGTLSINNAAITTGTISTTPTNATDLANKAYVDSISGGLDPHASVRLTTIAAIGGSYRQQSGSAGTTWGGGDYIIATTTAELIGSMSGLDTPVSGIALTAGQRVLIKDGVTGGYASGSGNFGAFPSTFGGFAASYVANGIYTVISWGGAATSGWLLQRATDTDNAFGVQELQGGTFTFVEEGTSYADNAFVCTNDTTSLGPIGFGSTQITWSAFSGGASLTMGQGLSKSGNTIATNYNLALATAVTTNLSRGFSIGGARSGSVGSSSYDTFTVTGSNAALGSATLTVDNAGYTLAGGETAGTVVSLLLRGVTANNTITGNADGWTHAGGTTVRTLNVIGGDILLNGAGFGLTLGSQSILSTNSQTLALSTNMGNLTFQVGNSTPSASTQNIVQNGVTQYQLSTSSGTFTTGDIYYGAGTAFTALSRLAYSAGTGNSVLVRGVGAPAWGTVVLGSSDFVSGTLTTTNGGTSNGSITTTNGQVVYTDGSKFNTTVVGTADQFLKSAGSGAPVWSAITLSNATSVTGQLGIANGGTGANLSASNGGIVYSGPTAFAVLSGTATAGLALVSGASAAPSWSVLSLTGGGTNNSVSGAGISYQLAQYNASGAAISSIALPTANNSVLISSTTIAPQWSNGALGITYGGTAATSLNFSSNGVVIYDSTNLRLTSATGLTMTGGVGLTVTGTVNSSGGFFTGGNSVVATNVSGVAGQVLYFSGSSTATGITNFTFSPTAATGVGLSINISTATSGTALRLNTQAAWTSGLLIDVDNNSTQAFAVDWKGMATHTASASGNTALVVAGGRTILPAPTANYASLNLAASSSVNPGAGITQIGDLWFNGTNLYFRKDATTNFDLLVGSVSGSGTANKIAKWNTTTSLTDSNISDAGFGMTITSGSSIGPGTGSTALLTLQTLPTDDTKTDRFFIRGAGSGGTRYFSVDTSGNLRATTKSFDIPHPTREGMRLVYGVLEGPEHGVYHRGTVEGKGVIQVNLPEYWHKLVGDQYTIQITPWGNYSVGIGSKTENYFTIQLVGDVISRKFKNIKVDYIVHGSRLDAPLDIEQ